MLYFVNIFFKKFPKIYIESGPKRLFGAFLEIFQLRWKKTQDRKESTCSQVMYYLLQAIQKKQ